MKLKLGVTAWDLRRVSDGNELSRQARLAEQCGYDYFVLPENHFGQDGAIPDPLMLLANAAAVTDSIRLATTSYLLPLRHPVLAAEQVAVLDRLSGGRITLGIGRGYATTLFDAFGIDATKKRSLFRANLETMLKAWRGEPIRVSDESTSIVSPRPLQLPHPPIWIAAFGALALSQAGSFGFPYLASPMETKSRLKENYQKHIDACIAAELKPPQDIPIMRSIYVSDDAATIRSLRTRLDNETRRLVRSSQAHAGDALSADWAIVGDGTYLRDVVDEYRETLNMTTMVVTRLRIGGMPREDIESSITEIPELLSR